MHELKTERLFLRKLQPGDAHQIFTNWADDPEVTKYLTWEPHSDESVTKSILQLWLAAYDDANETTYRWGIERQSDHTLMGMIDVVGYHHGNPVIGYVLGRAFWNHGYMTEACRAVMQELLADGYDTIVIEAAEPNIGSNRVIEKCGFELVGTWERDFKDRDYARKAEPGTSFLPINSYRYFRNGRTSGTYTDINAATIDRWVEEGWEWGQPVSHEDCDRARKGDWQVVLTPTKPVPGWWFTGNMKEAGQTTALDQTVAPDQTAAPDASTSPASPSPSLSGLRILGLASGGGQQMPLFALAGAECWVLDYSGKQIEAEKMVAAREGYRIHAIRADMTQPLPFSDGFFDLIFHPVSNCYIKDVEPVWKECARILKPGGRLLAGLDNGINFLFEEDDETHITGTLPFDPLVNEAQRKTLEAEDCGMQFSHTIGEQIGGQLRAGFRLLDVYDDTNGAGNLHEHGVPCFWATLAEKIS